MESSGSAFDEPPTDGAVRLRLLLFIGFDTGALTAAALAASPGARESASQISCEWRLATPRSSTVGAAVKAWYEANPDSDVDADGGGGSTPMLSPTSSSNRLRHHVCRLATASRKLRAPVSLSARVASWMAQARSSQSSHSGGRRPA